MNENKAPAILTYAREKAKGNIRAALDAIDAAIDCSESTLEIESLERHRKETAELIPKEPKPLARRWLAWFWSDKPVKTNE